MLPITILLIVSAQSLHSSHAAVANHPVEEMPIMYPEPIENKPFTHENMVEEVPEACKDLTYCTIKPKNYPEEKFNEMLKGYRGPSRNRRETKTGLKPTHTKEDNENVKK